MQSAIEQNNGTMRYNDIVPPGRKQRLDDWVNLQGKTMAGKARQSILNLDRSAFQLSPDEALLYSEWNRSGIQFTPQQRDMQRELAFRYTSLGSRRCQVTVGQLVKLDSVVGAALSNAMITQTMTARRAFWKNPSELALWKSWLRLWSSQPDPAVLAVLDGDSKAAASSSSSSQHVGATPMVVSQVSSAHERALVSGLNISSLEEWNEVHTHTYAHSCTHIAHAQYRGRAQ